MEKAINLNLLKKKRLKLKKMQPNFIPESLISLSNDEFLNSGVSRQKNFLYQGFVPFDN